MRGWLCRICEVHVTHTKERDSAPSPSPRLFAGNKCLSVTSVYNAVENAACLHPGGKFLKSVFLFQSSKQFLWHKLSLIGWRQIASLPMKCLINRERDEESVENVHFLPRTLSIGDKFDTRCIIEATIKWWNRWWENGHRQFSWQSFVL